MTTFLTVIASLQTLFSSLPTASQQTTISLILWLTGFLCLLNVGLALFYRRRRIREVVSYYLSCAIEFIIFVLALLLQVHVTSIFYHLPPGLPFNQVELGAALAIAIGLFPAAYWHGVNISELPKRIAEDGQNMKKGKGKVQVRNSTPGEWMN